MAVYQPILPNVPPWLFDRVEYMGLSGAAAMLRSLAASASEDSDSVSAAAFNHWVSVIESARQYPSTASGRATIMSLHKA
jgi:hypothetical protein